MEKLKKTRLQQLLIMLCIIGVTVLAEGTRLRNYIGYSHVKETVLRHTNLYAAAQKFFGKLGDVFFINDAVVGNEVQQELIQIDGGVQVKQDIPSVYSKCQGVVIEKGTTYVVIQTVKERYRYANITEIQVSLYEQVFVGTKIGHCPEVEGIFIFFIMEA